MFEPLNLAHVASKLLEFGILLFQVKQLLVDVARTPASLKIQDLLEVLHFLLKFLDVEIVSCAHLVSHDLDHDLLGPVCKL